MSSRGPRKIPRIRARVAVAGLLASQAGDRLPGGRTRGVVAGGEKEKLATTTSISGILEMMTEKLNMNPGNVLVKHGTPVHLGHSCVLMVCEFQPCASCGRLMVPRLDPFRNTRLFPCWHELTLEQQAKRGGLATCSDALKDGEKICEDCKATGKSTFVCALCKQERPCDQIREHFGDPPDYLCKPCYQTVPAKDWDAEVESLEQAHR